MKGALLQSTCAAALIFGARRAGIGPLDAAGNKESGGEVPPDCRLTLCAEAGQEKAPLLPFRDEGQ